MRDAVHIGTIEFGRMPQVKDYTPTVTIESVELGPDGNNGGYAFSFTPRAWPNVQIATWTGPLQYTVFVGRKVAGVWHMAGVIQMWANRKWTGAPISSFWKDWAYDRSWVGELFNLDNAIPGEEILFMLVHGNARYGMEREALSLGSNLPERSNIIKIIMPAVHQGKFVFGNGVEIPSNPPSIPEPSVPTLPVPPTTPIVDTLGSVLADIMRVQNNMLTVIEAQNELIGRLVEDVQEIRKNQNNPYVGQTFLGSITIRRDSTRQDVKS